MQKRLKRKVKFLKFVLSLAFISLAILFVLCSKSQENKTDIKEGVVKTEELASNNEGGLPQDFPIYQNSKLTAFAESEDKSGMSYIWETEDEAGLVYGYLKSELRIGGWNLYDESSVGSSSAVSFEKSGNEGFVGVFVGSSGKTIISVSIRLP